MTQKLTLLQRLEPLGHVLNIPTDDFAQTLSGAGADEATVLERLDQIEHLYKMDHLESTLILALLFDCLTGGKLRLVDGSLADNSLAIFDICKSSSNRIVYEGSPLSFSALVAQAPAHLNSTQPFCRLQPEIANFLLGSNDIPELLKSYLKESTEIKSYATWDLPQSETLTNSLKSPRSLSLVYSGDFYQDLYEIRRIAGQAGRRVFQVDLQRLTAEVPFENVGEWLKRLANTLRIHGACAVLPASQSAQLQGPELTYQMALLDELSGVPTLVLVNDMEAPLKKAIQRPYFEFASPSRPGALSSAALWRLELAERKIELPEQDLAKVESLFPFSLSKIERVLGQLELEQESKQIIDYQTLASLCRRQSSRVLEQLSRRIEPKYRWDDLMLPPASKLKLSEIYHYIAGRSRTERDWNLRSHHNRGHGVAVVLKGASGTGKTMAAEVLAHELGLDLYQVDLASLTSKYVGETEKNLSRVFQAAREASGILLFDEGEVLFSQRTQVNSSQDKYANLEVNYLLQELEAFDGIVIISTNNARSIDTAFLRRVTFDLEIPRPDEATRKEIWRSHLDGGLPIASDVNFDFLSQLSVSGGLIRNIVKQATSIASQHGDEIRMEDILHAIKREFKKVDQPLEREFFGETYWPLVSQDWETIYARKRQKDLLKLPSGRRTLKT